ncbi:hypothetical protein PSNVIR_01867 [Pseudomonas sp. Nvir]|nr:hypothetical protein PSNVIR_01867 [Pseudomonas sp. Nvir]
MVVLAIAGPVLDHTRFAAEGFPAVVAAQAQGVAVGHHQAFDIAETAHAVAVAVAHRAQLAMLVVTVLGERFDRMVVHHALDIGQAAQRVVVVQVHAGAAGGADVGQGTVRRAGEVEEVAEDVLDTLQRHFGVGVWHFTEVEEQVVEGLQDVVAALGAHQVHLLVRVVDPLTRLQGHEGDFAALVVGEVDETAAATQTLFPR